MPILERLAPDLAARMAEARVPGLAIALVRDGAVAEARGFGVTSVDDRGLPVTPQTLFQIGSTTKPLTGMMIMRLVAAGLLALIALSSSICPPSASPSRTRPSVSLCACSSATPPGSPGTRSPTRLHGRRDLAGLADYVRDELPTRPLVAPPGTRWEYSNPGINLAAHLAEVVTGRTYPT